MTKSATSVPLENDPLPDLCRACKARHRGICGALDAQQLAELNRRSHKQVVEPGKTLMDAEEPTSAYSNILAGVVKLSKMLPDGRQQIVGLQFAPDFVGRPFSQESALKAEAVTSTVLCTFPRNVLERMIADSAGLEHNLYLQALAELDDARDLLLTLGRKTARERVATFLLMIARHTPKAEGTGEPQGSTDFELPLTRAEIADFLGLTIETVSRQLTKLKGSGVIRVEANRRICVPDLELLEAETGD
ncbi:Crp/Fnr family transcriptional regulator [Afifella sp. IM 167]|uniref:Crp/Fnr family transcriptional regulator n=1 Tax=Afifella sp. IM 167 TaxID=2033586 RepID=UPI001CCEA7FA|nr:Crp/Fnr family transcriptional regulator [Afifella sp. IM 167]MBZ8132082.1 transcriptional regulator [Afifella sp. IM 167]